MASRSIAPCARRARSHCSRASRVSTRARPVLSSSSSRARCRARFRSAIAFSSAAAASRSPRNRARSSVRATALRCRSTISGTRISATSSPSLTGSPTAEWIRTSLPSTEDAASTSIPPRLRMMPSARTYVEICPKMAQATTSDIMTISAISAVHALGVVTYKMRSRCSAAPRGSGSKRRASSDRASDCPRGETAAASCVASAVSSRASGAAADGRVSERNIGRCRRDAREPGPPSIPGAVPSAGDCQTSNSWPERPPVPPSCLE